MNKPLIVMYDCPHSCTTPPGEKIHCINLKNLAWQARTHHTHMQTYSTQFTARTIPHTIHTYSMGTFVVNHEMWSTKHQGKEYL